MKFICIICFLALTLVACRRSPHDPIDTLVAELPYHTVPSYMFAPIKLPLSASPDSLIRELEQRGTFSKDGIARYKILQRRSVHTTPRERDLRARMTVEHYTAVLLDTNVGLKIVLLKPLLTRAHQDVGWYYRIYDCK